MKLKEAREHAGMSVQELARQVEVSPVAIWRYENGKRIPRTRIAKRIADVLGMAWWELIDDQKAG